MNRVVAWIAFAAVAIAAAGALAADPLNPAWGTIFAGEKARALMHQCSRGSPGPVGGTWTPSEADIAALEPALAKLLDEQLAKRRFPGSAAEYYRQYGGLVIAGRRMIYVNGFHKYLIARRGNSGELLPPAETWRSQAVMICDGGPIVFGVEYDPATAGFVHFSFNGSV